MCLPTVLYSCILNPVILYYTTPHVIFKASRYLKTIYLIDSIRIYIGIRIKNNSNNECDDTVSVPPPCEFYLNRSMYCSMLLGTTSTVDLQSSH